MCLLNCTENQTSLNSSQVRICELYHESTSVKCIKALVYSMIMIISLCGNLAIIAIVLKNIRMWTTTNFLIVNMAASDLLISVFAIPREFVFTFTGPRRWLLDGLTGLIMCKLVYFFQDISTAVSIQSLVVIAIDRQISRSGFPVSPSSYNNKGFESVNFHYLDCCYLYTLSVFLYCATYYAR